MRFIRIKPAHAGILSSSALFIFYLAITVAGGSVEHAIWQIKEYWYLLIPLIAGFGIQTYLYSTLKMRLKSQKSLAVSGGISAGSMVACCSHHVTDLIPFLGITALSTSLTRYIPLFLLFGVLSNLIGITLMLERLQKADIHKGKVLSWLMKYDMKALKYTAIAVSVILFLVSIAYYKTHPYNVFLSQ